MPETNMTFEKIIEKTKRMLGKNYRGDKELVPVYSLPTMIEGHTDAVSVISNDGFTNEELTLIKEKTKNYAWWVANHGYVIDASKKEIPALLIYGSEIGNISPDVLNFNGKNYNNFYYPINRTNQVGIVNDSMNHMYVQFILNNEMKSFETDINGTNNGVLNLDGIEYEFYAGRLYPEDRKVIDNNICYPINLISNLEYYTITADETKALNGAHDANFVEQNNLEILKDTCEMVVHEAAQWTNRPINIMFLNDCWPIVVKCSCIAYLNRGVEGLASQSELGQQNSYRDWVTVLHRQLTNRRYVL